MRLGLRDIASLLQIAHSDKSATDRLSAIHILTRLPLSDEAWSYVARAAVGTLNLLERSGGLNEASLNVLAAVPVRSIRVHLAAIARTSDHPASLKCSLALARQGDSAGIDVLLQAVRRLGEGEIVQHVACLPLENLNVASLPFEELLQSCDLTTCFWAAVALARLGEPELLREAFDAILDLQGGIDWVNHPRFPGSPPLFDGSPGIAYAALAAARPLPAKLTNFLIELCEARSAQLKERVGSWAELPREAVTLVGGLTGAFDADGAPIAAKREEVSPAPPPSERDAQRAEAVAERLLARFSEGPDLVDLERKALAPLAAMPPERGGQFMVAVLEAIEAAGKRRESPLTPLEALNLNNAILDIASALPQPMPLPVGELVEKYISEGVPLSSAALPWLLGRAGAKAIVGDLGSRISEAVGETRHPLFAWGLAIADQLNAPPPFAGAGASSSMERPAAPRVIEDVGQLLETRTVVRPAGAAVGKKKFSPERSTPRWSMRVDRERPGRDSVHAEEAVEPGVVRFGGKAKSVEPPTGSRIAWPHVHCDDVVEVGVPFPLEVGIGRQRDVKLTGTGAMELPSGAFELEIELILDPSSFALVEGERCFSLAVTDDDPYPTRTVTLVALGGEGLDERRHIGVTYRADGIIRGYAARDVTIARIGASEPSAAAEKGYKEAGGIDMSPFLAADEADLTIVIRHGDDAAGQTLLFSACSPVVEIREMPQAPNNDIGDRPNKFAEAIVRKASASGDPEMLFDWLVGRGKVIASKLPGVVRKALVDVATKAASEQRTATVLVISEDPYIPWELAVLEPALPTPGCCSPFLGAQVVLGRWVLSKDRPPPRPPRRVTVRESAVVSGNYEGMVGWKRLVNAEEEARHLVEQWPPARGVEASYKSVRRCLRGQVSADTLHFALHGRFDSTGLQGGLVLVGQTPGRPDVPAPVYLEPDHVRRGNLSARKPFVFLNACQVGAGDELLGDYAGMAAAFLFAGASAVVAPLWSVDDGQAHDIALAFYGRAYQDGVPPAEILRSERARYCESTLTGPDAVSGTHLAYQFFGHPRFMLKRVANEKVNTDG